MARRTVERGRGVIGHLARGSNAVVAALAMGDQPGVIEACRGPGECAVTIAAVVRGGYMVHGLCRGGDAIVTTQALLLLQQVGMLHAGRNEGHGGMARRAVIVGRDVFGVLACGRDPVVTTDARALRRGVIHPENGREVVAGVTEDAAIVAQDVSGRLGCRADAATDGVAPRAIARRAFEYAVDMAILASHVPMGVAQLESCSQVVEAGALQRKG